MAKVIFIEPNGLTAEQTSATFTTRVVSVTNATQAVNCQITAVGHGLGVGEHVIFRSIGGMTQLNSTQDGYETGTFKRVASVIDADNFTLDIDSTSFTAYTSGGELRSNGVKRANGGEVTLAGHTLQVGQRVYISGVIGSTQVNSSFYKVGTVYPNGVQLLDDITGLPVNWSTIGSYTSGGIFTYYDGILITGATNANPCVLTCYGHGWSDDDYIYVNDNSGMTEINEKVWKVANATANTVELVGCDSTAFGTFSAGQGYAHRTYKLSTTVTNLATSIIARDEIRYSQTTPPTDIAGGRTFTWIYESATINYTGTTLVGTLVNGDIICRKNRGGNGDQDGCYEVIGVSGSAITIRARYGGIQGTGVDDTIRKINPVTTMSPATLGTVNANGVIIRGGYDFDTNLQTGETWLKGLATITTTSSIGAIVSNGGECSNINFTESYHCASISSGTFKNSTILKSYLYTLLLNSASMDLGDIYVGTNQNGSPAWASLVASSGANPTFIDPVRVQGVNGVNNQAVILAGKINCNNLLEVHCSGFSLNMSSDSWITAIEIYKNFGSVGVQFGANRINGYIKDSIIDVIGAYGIYVGTLSGGILAESNIISGATNAGFLATQSGRIIAKRNDFQNNVTNIRADQYSGSIRCIGNNHNSPTNWGILRDSYSTGSIEAIGEIIDIGSIHKAYAINSNNENILPQYSFQNCWNGFSGRIYGKGSVTLDPTITDTAGNATVRVAPTNVWSDVNTFGDVQTDVVYVNAGDAITIPFHLRADGVWSGTVTPILRLNGVDIVTGTTITAMTNGSWDAHTISATGIQVTEDGCLELVLYVVANIVAFNAKVEGGIF